MRHIIYITIINLCFTSLGLSQKVELTPLYNTIGIKITEYGSADSCSILYKSSGEETWKSAFPPNKVVISGIDQWRGCLFLLQENSVYNIKITLWEGQTSTDLPILNSTTLLSPNITPTQNVKWVSPSGQGDFSKKNPGNITQLFSSKQVTFGTTIMLMDGIYKVSELRLTLSTDCTEGTPIILMAAQGAHPIVDGGVVINKTWTLHSTVPNLYFTSLPSNSNFSNICLLGNKALYPYPALYPDLDAGKYNLKTLNFGYDGFVRNENYIWIKTQEGINPNDSTVTVSNANRFITITGNYTSAYLKVKGITFQHFGKPNNVNLEILPDLGIVVKADKALVFDIRAVNHILFDSCNFKYNNGTLRFNYTCNDITIEHCTFKEEIGKWTHAMIKKSNNYTVTEHASWARQLESEAIFLAQGKSIVIRNNLFDGSNSGIEGDINTGLHEDIDINDNLFTDNYDALECDGLWTNIRVWNNEMIRPMSAISAAPPAIGPRYFYRNVFHGMKGRRNEADDTPFKGCDNDKNIPVSNSVGLKTNIGVNATLKGDLFFINNTFHAIDSLGFIFTPWTSEWRKAIFINNSYSHANGTLFHYMNLASKDQNSDFQLTSINDNYYSYKNSEPVARIRYINGQAACTQVNSVADLQSILSEISTSPNILISNPTHWNPEFSNMDKGRFELERNSPLIDAGIAIPGFYDFEGLRPDIGAKESKYTVATHLVPEQPIICKVYPNPTWEGINIEIAEENELHGILLNNEMGQIAFKSKDLTGNKYFINLNNVYEGVYFLTLYTRQGIVRTKIVKL